MSFVINGSTFSYGDFINALVSFLIMATVIFFFVVQPVNHLVKLGNRKENKAADEKSPEVAMLEEIRDLLKEGKDGKKRS